METDICSNAVVNPCDSFQKKKNSSSLIICLNSGEIERYEIKEEHKMGVTSCAVKSLEAPAYKLIRNGFAGFHSWPEDFIVTAMCKASDGVECSIEAAFIWLDRPDVSVSTN